MQDGSLICDIQKVPGSVLLKYSCDKTLLWKSKFGKQGVSYVNYVHMFGIGIEM